VTIRNAASGNVLATTTTNGSGAYTVEVQFNGDVIIEITGGTYTDEATGDPTTLTATLRSVVNISGGAVTAHVTPVTTLAYAFAFGPSTTVTAAAFNTSLTSFATALGLTGNLNTTLPVVTGEGINDYGRILRAFSQVLVDFDETLAQFLDFDLEPVTHEDLAGFAGELAAAYLTINGISISFNFDGIVIGGVAGGGGSGTCGIHVVGTITSGLTTVPLNANFCVTGLVGSCDSGNATISSALAGALAGGAELAYTFSPTCADGATVIALTP